MERFLSIHGNKNYFALAQFLILDNLLSTVFKESEVSSQESEALPITCNPGFVATVLKIKTEYS